MCSDSLVERMIAGYGTTISNFESLYCVSDNFVGMLVWHTWNHFNKIQNHNTYIVCPDNWVWWRVGGYGTAQINIITLLQNIRVTIYIVNWRRVRRIDNNSPFPQLCCVNHLETYWIIFPTFLKRIFDNKMMISPQKQL